jgi:hypothetical protein
MTTRLLMRENGTPHEEGYRLGGLADECVLLFNSHPDETCGSRSISSLHPRDEEVEKEEGGGGGQDEEICGKKG